MPKKFNAILIAASLLLAGPHPPAMADTIYDESVSGDLEDTDLGDLGLGRNTVLGSVDGTFPAGPDAFQFNVPTGRQLIGATLEVSNYQDSVAPAANVNAFLVGVDGVEEPPILAEGSIAMDGRFILAPSNPPVPLPQPAGDGYGGLVSLSGNTGSATADWNLGIITAGSTRHASIDHGPIGSTYARIARSTSIFNGNNFDGDGFVLDADFNGKALRYEGGSDFLARLSLIYDGDQLDLDTIDTELLSVRLIGAEGSEDTLLTNLRVGQGGPDTQGLWALQFDARHSPGLPVGYTFSGFEMLGLLPSATNTIVDAEIRMSTEFGGPTTYTVVPEPTSLALLTLGGLLVARRQRR